MLFVFYLWCWCHFFFARDEGFFDDLTERALGGFFLPFVRDPDGVFMGDEFWG